jgi:predicted metal-binding membrane protein
MEASKFTGFLLGKLLLLLLLIHMLTISNESKNSVSSSSNAFGGPVKHKHKIRELKHVCLQLSKNPLSLVIEEGTNQSKAILLLICSIIKSDNN